MLNSISTIFDEIRFRSRAEARWAYVFRYFGVKYFYETEGFRLRGGVYLPDFYLPGLDIFFEVKGRAPNARELLLADQLCESEKRIVVVTHGPPDPTRHPADRDLTIFVPEVGVDDLVFADQHEGCFVSARREGQSACSIDLGNGAFLPFSETKDWLTAFRLATNHRFGRLA